MTAVTAALWGLLGGVALEGFDNADVMRRTGKWPWRTPARHRSIGLDVWLVAVACRLAAGAATAAAAGAGDVIANAIGAFGVGAAGMIALQAIIARTTAVPPRDTARADEQAPPEVGGEPAPAADASKERVHESAGAEKVASEEGMP